MSQKLLDFARTIGRMHGLHHRADVVDAEPGDEKLDNVGQVNGDDIATPQAGAMQPGGECRHPIGELPVGERDIAGDDGRPVRVVRHAAVEPVTHGLVAPPAAFPEMSRIETHRRGRHVARTPRSIGFIGYITALYGQADADASPAQKRPDRTRDI